MSDLIPFENFSSTNGIVDQSSGLIWIVLEGRDDAKLFREYWFTDYQSRLKFVAADQLAGCGGGSEGVVAGVRERRGEGLEAFGVVDRDTLFRTRCWTGLYGTDPDALLEFPVDEHVYTTALWEVEAYTLDEPRLRDWVEGNHQPPPGPQEACDAALAIAVRECEALLAASPMFAALHVAGRKLETGYFLGDDEAAIRLKAAVAIATVEWRHQVVAVIVEAMLDDVIEDTPAAHREKLAWYLRYVDTKRLLVRLKTALNLNPGANHWQLAVAMKRSGYRPPDL